MRLGMMGRAVVTAALAVTTLGPGTIVHGAPPRSDDDGAYYAAVARRIDQVGRSGNAAAVDRMLEREFGWVKAAGGEDAPEPVPLGTPSASNVSLPTPTIYRNTQRARYEVLARWQWRNCGSLRCWAANYGNAYGNDGGPDGFGVVSSIAVNPVTTSFVTFNNRGTMQS